jgi:hypothetical protein
MTSYQLSGTGSVSVVAAEGATSQCRVTATMSAGTSLSFSVATSGWVYVTRTQARKVLSEMVIETDGSTTYVDIFGGPKSTHTERVFLPPGQYVAISTYVVNSGPFLGFRAGAPTATLAGDFHVAGSALGGVRGAGRRFVALPDSISCSDHSARLTWKGKVGQVARASIRVNGRLKASVDNPRPGHSLVLRHLGKRADNTITADLTLDGGGHATASRDYLPCRG